MTGRGHHRLTHKITSIPIMDVEGKGTQLLQYTASVTKVTLLRQHMRVAEVLLLLLRSVSRLSTSHHNEPIWNLSWEPDRGHVLDQGLESKPSLGPQASLGMEKMCRSHATLCGLLTLYNQTMSLLGARTTDSSTTIDSVPRHDRQHLPCYSPGACLHT